MRIRYFIRCFSALLKMSVTRLWAYRTDFWMSLLLSGITLSADLLGLWFVASRTSVLAGWSAQGLVFLLGTHFIVLGVIEVALYPSTVRFIEGIHDGSADLILLNPGPRLFLIGLSEVAFGPLTHVLLGVGITIATWLNAGGGLLRLAHYVMALALGVGTLAAWCYLIAGIGMMMRRGKGVLIVANQILETVGRWPLGLHALPLQIVLTFVVPVGLAITVPANSFFESGQLVLLVVSFVGSVLLAIGTWRMAVRSYIGAQS